MTDIALKELLKELSKWGLKYKVCEWRVKIYGGDKKARYHYERVLQENSDLEAQLILYASNSDETLRDMIEERAAIRWADGLPGDLLSAVKCNMVVRKNEAEG